MYDNLTLFYLNLMGIFPWLNRDSCISFNVDDNSRTSKLLVFVPSQLNPGAAKLMKHILTFLGLEQSRIKVIAHNSMESSTMENECPINPLMGVLSFVPKLNIQSKIGNRDIPCLSTIELDALISNPLEKKKAFIDLAQFKVNLFKILNAHEV